MEKQSIRNHNIDFFRGIAAIAIILIHTSFWSGTNYVPDYIRSITLLIDVPIFIFISGMSFNYNNSIIKTLKSYSKLWKKWIVFLVLYFITLLVIDKNAVSLNMILKSIFFNLPSDQNLPVVASSLWFLFMYFIVTLICNTIIVTYNKNFDNINNFKYIIITVFLFYGISLYNKTFIIIPTIILFYSFIYLLGYYLHNYNIKKFKEFLFIFIILLIIYLLFIYVLKIDFSLMQKYKFSYSINYLLHSSFGILIVYYLKDKIHIKEKNIFVFIGKNALPFYFCQGISASIIYYILPNINIDQWYLKFIIMFIINIIITSLYSLLLIYILKLVDKLEKRFYYKYEKE